MRKIHELTESQQQFASAHHEIVHAFIRSNQLDEDEFYDVVIFGYLLAVQEYLEKPSLSEHGFDKIAWRNMKDCIADEYAYRCRGKRSAVIAPFEEDTTLDGFLPDRMHRMAEILDDQDALSRLLACLTPKELEVVTLKADGYTYREIADLCSISAYGVESRFSRMRRRLRAMALI